jgi:uncharacterized delta-60 repeat protein
MRARKRLLIAAIFLFLGFIATISLAQQAPNESTAEGAGAGVDSAAVTQEWKRWYGAKGTGGDGAVGVVVDASGNTYVTGSSKGSGTLADIVTLKYGPQGEVLWTKRYNGSGKGNDAAWAIALDGLGNVCVSGSSYGSAKTGHDFITLKYDTNGNLLWEKSYNGPGNGDDRATAIAVDAAGNVYVTGESYGVGSGYDYATLKYDTNGNLLWKMRYNGSANGDDGATAIAVDAAGNVYVTGFSSGNDGYYPYDDYATLKYDPSGTLLWQRRYNGPGNFWDWATAIAVDAAGNVYVTGYSYESGFGDGYATLKYDPSGNLLWKRRHDGSGNTYDHARAIAVDGTGNVYVTGGSADDYATLKYDPSGSLLWKRRYNGPANGDDGATAIAVDAAGNVYVTGYSVRVSSGRDYATLKYDTNGNLLWKRRYNGPGNAYDYARAIAVDVAGNVYVTGESYGVGSGYDYATLKYDTNGKLLWEMRYNGPGSGDDRATAITLDATGNVYVSGESYGVGSGFDYATLKYDTNGDLLWEKRYNGPANRDDGATAIVVDAAGNVYVSGGSYGAGYDRYHYTILKYDTNGNLLWEKHYGPANPNDGETAIAVDAAGNVYVSGESAGNYATLKYDTNGNLLWEKLYNGQGNTPHQPQAIAVDGTGNVYVTGYSVRVNSDWDYATLKYDTNGNLLWLRRYNGQANSSDYAQAIAVDVAGNVYVTGESYGVGSGYDYATLKYDTNGKLLWLRRYNGPGKKDDHATAIAVDAAGNVYVTGESYGVGSGYDYATLKYDTNGKLLWEKRTNGSGNSEEQRPSLALDSSGNVYLTGGSDLGYLTVKFSQ